MLDSRPGAAESKDTAMTWTTPKLVEVCIGLEVTGYVSAED